MIDDGLTHPESRDGLSQADFYQLYAHGQKYLGGQGDSTSIKMALSVVLSISTQSADIAESGKIASNPSTFFMQPHCFLVAPL